MTETAIELSKELRDPNGPHKVDLIIALTHCRLPNVRSLRSAMVGNDVLMRRFRILIWRMSLGLWLEQMWRRSMV